jgi:hypothetical protein
LSHSASTLLSHSAGKRKASLRHGRNLNIEAVSELSVREACKLAGLCDRAPDLTNIESWPPHRARWVASAATEKSTASTWWRRSQRRGPVGR